MRCKAAHGAIVALITGLAGCVVEERCYDDADCVSGKLCDSPAPGAPGSCRAFTACEKDSECGECELCDLAVKRCVPADCCSDQDCHPRFRCEAGRCVSREPLECADDMVVVENQFCIDRYEASRVDATAALVGSDGRVAVSQSGVLPWMVANNAEAQGACEAAGKTLCSESQWYLACAGADGALVYGYGNSYSPLICNGIDKYCRCGAGSPCEGEDPCPYPHCYRTCGTTRPLMTDPTGSNPGCQNPYGIFDMNGNVWEHVLGGDETRIRGGAYNCVNSEQLHRCDYIPGTWKPSARGFRCCNLGLPAGATDGGDDGTGQDAGDPGLVGDGGGG
ncbi:SUMF1/EgtB/PvdO family nonheme iron enzyme [Myxococcota bacterium]